jgi:hypothetical protein
VKIGKRIMTPLYLDPPQKAALRKLSDRTRVPMAVYLREGVDMLLAKYKLKGDQRLNPPKPRGSSCARRSTPASRTTTPTATPPTSP